MPVIEYSMQYVVYHGNQEDPFEKETALKDPTPLQKGLEKAAGPNYYDLGPVEERTVDRMGPSVF